MNEQLIVKNFGPIKDATVDFKRVTVFIGPTGGGKSTLAKLAAISRANDFYKQSKEELDKKQAYSKYSISSYFRDSTEIYFRSEALFNTDNFSFTYQGGKHHINFSLTLESDILDGDYLQNIEDLIKKLAAVSPDIKIRKTTHGYLSDLLEEAKKTKLSPVRENNVEIKPYLSPVQHYFPAERNFLAALEYSWPGLLRDDIGLPKDTLEFANTFSVLRRNIPELDIKFLKIKYLHKNGQDFIKIPNVDSLFRLYETASGIKSTVPLLVLLEHFNNLETEAQSFIIEEPELNLFPTAQFELIKSLINKCAGTESANDLIITTHSPYVLTALNLLCYAFRIAQQDEATARKVAKLIPRHCWIDPNQFAAYYVDRPDTKRKQQVRSIINKKTGLIEENELDTASDELGAIFDKLVRLRKPTPTPSRAK